MGLVMYLREIYNVTTKNAKFCCRVFHPLFQTLHFIAQALVDAWSRRHYSLGTPQNVTNLKRCTLYIEKYFLS